MAFDATRSPTQGSFASVGPAGVTIALPRDTAAMSLFCPVDIEWRRAGTSTWIPVPANAWHTGYEMAVSSHIDVRTVSGTGTVTIIAHSPQASRAGRG